MTDISTNQLITKEKKQQSLGFVKKPYFSVGIVASHAFFECLSYF